MGIIFDGVEFAQEKEKQAAKKIKELKKAGFKPALASAFLAADKASVQYTNIKKQAARRLGIKFLTLPQKSGDVEAVGRKIARLSQDEKIHGIILQHPSEHSVWDKQDWARLVSLINPEKDVDCLTPTNFGLLSLDTPRFLPAAVKAVADILANIGCKIAGKYIVIVGASVIFGRPASIWFANQGGTVSLLNSRSKNLKNITKKADILISATGCSGLIGKDMVAEGAVVIDLGAPQGDVEEEVAEKASFFTPVPGGVGPVTVACLLENTLAAAENLFRKNLPEK